MAGDVCRDEKGCDAVEFFLAVLTVIFVGGYHPLTEILTVYYALFFFFFDFVLGLIK